MLERDIGDEEKKMVNVYLGEQAEEVLEVKGSKDDWDPSFMNGKRLFALSSHPLIKLRSG